MKADRTMFNDKNVPEDQREQNGSAASWDLRRPRSFHPSSCRQTTCPFRQPLCVFVCLKGLNGVGWLCAGWADGRSVEDKIGGRDDAGC